MAGFDLWASADSAGSFSRINFLAGSAVDATAGDADGGLECATSEAKVLNEEAALIAALKRCAPQKATEPSNATLRVRGRDVP